MPPRQRFISRRQIKAGRTVETIAQAQSSRDEHIDDRIDFPVEENAAIYQFIARFDDEREIVAELKEKRCAQTEYLEALARGDGASLLEEDQSFNDIMILTPGSLQSGSRLEFTVSYVSELDLLHSAKKPTIRFVVPTVIAPRYSPVGTQVKYVQEVPYSIR